MEDFRFVVNQVRVFDDPFLTRVQQFVDTEPYGLVVLASSDAFPNVMGK
jgi:hypothetical protein